MWYSICMEKTKEIDKFTAQVELGLSSRFNEYVKSFAQYCQKNVSVLSAKNSKGALTEVSLVLLEEKLKSLGTDDERNKYLVEEVVKIINRQNDLIVPKADPSGVSS